jgi:ADP-heptose:LPS heptosyltransferase
MVNKKKLYGILELLRIRINNLLAFSLFVFLKQFFGKKNSKSKNILFINTGLLGDIVISTVILKNDAKLKKVFSTVYLLFDKRFSELFKDFDGQITILYVNLNKYRLNLFYRISFLVKLQKLNLESSINISFSRRTLDDEITLLNGSHFCLGFDNAPKIPKLFSNYIDSNYTKIIKPFTGNHYVDILYLLEKLGVNSPNPETLDFQLNKIPSEVTRFLDTKKRIICLAPVTSQAIKNWSSNNFVELANKIIEKFNVVIIILNEKQNHYFLKQNNSQIIDLTGRTSLEEAASIISISDLFIGLDSGLFHLAKANKIPRIGMIGGGAVNIVFPYGDSEKEILLFKEMDCFGCHWKCIYDNAHCLQEITVANVFDSIKLILEDEKIGQ